MKLLLCSSCPWGRHHISTRLSLKIWWVGHHCPTISNWRPVKKNNSANPLPSADCRCCRPFLDLLSRRTNSLLAGPSVPRPTLGFPEPSSDDQKPKVGDNGEAGRHCKDWDLFDKAHLEVGEVGEVGETRAQSTTSLNASKMVRSMDTPLEVLIVKYYYIIYSKIPAANILPSRLVY